MPVPTEWYLRDIIDEPELALLTKAEREAFSAHPDALPETMAGLGYELSPILATVHGENYDSGRTGVIATRILQIMGRQKTQTT